MATEKESGVPEILVTEDQTADKEPVGRPIVIYDEPEDSKSEATNVEESSAKSTEHSESSEAGPKVTNLEEKMDQKHVDENDYHDATVTVEKDEHQAVLCEEKEKGHPAEGKDNDENKDTTSVHSGPRESDEDSNEEGKERKSSKTDISDVNDTKSTEETKSKEERDADVEHAERKESEARVSQKGDDSDKEDHTQDDKLKVMERSEADAKQEAVELPQPKDQDNEARSVQHERHDVIPARDNEKEDQRQSDSSSEEEEEEEKESKDKPESTSLVSEKTEPQDLQQEPAMTIGKIVEEIRVPASARQPEMATSSISKLQKIVTNGITITHQSFNNEDVPLSQNGEDVDEASKSVRESISLWREREKSKSNEEVLRDFSQLGDAEEQAQAAALMAWTKSGKAKKKKAPTNTMIVRVKNKMRQTVDFGDRNIVIEEKKASRFDVSSPPAQPAFQVRKTSVIQPESETNVTSSWIENAIKQYEHENEIELVEMKFESSPKSQKGVYEAFVKARIGAQGESKDYHWIIKRAPNTTSLPNSYDKDTYMVTKLGCRMSDFVKAKKLKRSLSIPFRPVIMADSQYAILDNLTDYRKFEDKTGLDLEHVKCALRGLAKFHALSYVYFNQGNEDVHQFSEDLKMMIDRFYQKSANATDKQIKRDQLDMDFRRVLSLLRTVDEEGEAVAKEAEQRFGDDLYSIFQRAHLSSNQFSVLCHGNPVASNMYFRYSEQHNPVDVKFVGFEHAVYGQFSSAPECLHYRG
ncbi:hypothetical protein TCAL_17285 [Tigriopus californicus]|uniref:CHK kinase-like domain-containing protein n=1 Tax=Tigriopus californicus TaxID=6832 RepID=A0A553NYY8_TIGCA|nr:hypothetical protein TCAL_17285 [Tigriopus californicus]